MAGLSMRVAFAASPALAAAMNSSATLRNGPCCVDIPKSGVAA
jgi:hypothetical protein